MVTLNNTARLSFITILGLALSLGCSQAAPEPTSSDVGTPESTVARGIPGYLHRASNSHFNLGALLRTQNEAGFDKVVGEHGVFAVDRENGSADAVPNADFIARPFAGGIEAHNQRVREYFIAAGLPANQIASVHATVGMSGGGAVDEAPSRPDAREYTTIVDRSWQSIPIVESHAWARLDENGDVVAEGVYWPELSESVKRDAQDLVDMLHDRTRAAAFLAKLPTGTSEGRVVIRHSSHFEHGLTSTASYDANDIDEKGRPGRLRHFAINGVEFRLPQEARIATPDRRDVAPVSRPAHPVDVQALQTK